MADKLISVHRRKRARPQRAAHVHGSHTAEPEGAFMSPSHGLVASPLEVGRCLTEEQAAQHCGVSRKSLRRWRKGGLVPFVKLPGRNIRYRAGDILKFIASRVRINRGRNGLKRNVYRE